MNLMIKLKFLRAVRFLYAHYALIFLFNKRKLDDKKEE